MMFYFRRLLPAGYNRYNTCNTAFLGTSSSKITVDSRDHTDSRAFHDNIRTYLQVPPSILHDTTDLSCLLFDIGNLCYSLTGRRIQNHYMIIYPICNTCPFKNHIKYCPDLFPVRPLPKYYSLSYLPGRGHKQKQCRFCFFNDSTTFFSVAFVNESSTLNF